TWESSCSGSGGQTGLLDRTRWRRAFDSFTQRRDAQLRPPFGVGGLDRVTRESADGSRHGQSHLAASLWPRARPLVEQLWKSRYASDISRAFGLASRGVGAEWLASQAAPSPDRNVVHLPHVLCSEPRSSGHRSRERSLLAL